MSSELADHSSTRTGGRDATEGVIPGKYALSVGMPKTVTPDGWVWTPLSSVARLETGHTPSRKHPEYWGGEVPWIGIRDATSNHGCTIYGTNQYTNELGIKNSSARVLPVNTVCLSRTASVGYVVVMGVPMATSQDFVNWVCGSAIDYRYLKYILLAEHDTLLRFASGTTHQTIYFPEAKAFHVCLPSLKVQNAISDLLQSLDDRIALLHKTNLTLEAIAQALFKSWFVDFDPVRAKQEGRVPVGMDEATAALFPDSFEHSEVGVRPQGWRLSTLAEAYEINPHRKLRRGEAAPYVEMASVPTSGHCVDAITSREMGSGSKFRNGDSLLARITPCLENGKTAFVDFLNGSEVGWGSTEFLVLRPKAPLPEYHGYLLCRHQPFRSYAIQSMSGTSGRQRIQNEALAKFPIIVPSEGIAQAFDRIVTPIQQRITANHGQSQTLKSLRDTLLPRLISGQLRLPDAEALVEEAAA